MHLPQGCARVSTAAADGGGEAGAADPRDGILRPGDAPLVYSDLLLSAEAAGERWAGGGEVYAHSAHTLYHFDPTSGAFRVVGDFSCLVFDDIPNAGMIDIAINRDGAMLGTAVQSDHGLPTGKVVSIDKANAQCTFLGSGSFPNSLTFVPVGTASGTEEVLVGYRAEQSGRDRSADRYVRIDPQSGTVSALGYLTAPAVQIPEWVSSGDIVSITGAGTYVTVVPGDGSSDAGGDRIAEVDPRDGRIKRIIGATGTSRLYGLGYWGGVAYGFSEAGMLVRIDLGDGSGTPVPIANVPSSGLAFLGAGTTTIAPITID
jgi:hypothetical protein